MPQPKIYLAGPEVFLPDAAKIGARKIKLCEEFELLGLFPLENDLPDVPEEKVDEGIFAANVEKMRRADAAIFNLSPFRGVNADPGTAFELGFFVALDKPVFAYSNSAQNLFERVAKNFGSQSAEQGLTRDDAGLMIEDFGNADNLMLDAALKKQGRAIWRPSAENLELADLEGFLACLREARRFFG
jgi:nucleoside 2-deoxyribosyltransferase